MNIREQLLIEHSQSNAQKIVDYIGTNPQRLQELMKCYFSKEYRLSQRSAMVVGKCFDSHPGMMGKYIPQMCEILEEKDLEIAVKRNTVRTLQFVAIPEELQAKLFDRCLHFLIDSNETIAVKAFSMTILYNICKAFPELKMEVIPLLEDLLKRCESPGIKNRGNKVLKKLLAL
mgnify:CR=1 FL=1